MKNSGLLSSGKIDGEKDPVLRNSFRGSSLEYAKKDRC